MLKKLLVCTLVASSIFFAECGVKDAIDDSFDALECANLVLEFEERNDNNPDRSCEDIVADINQIERTCSEYLSDSNIEQFNQLRAACEAN